MMKHKENKTYQLIPGSDDHQQWLVRLLSGPYTETVLRYGAISINEKDEGLMTFSFSVDSSPDSELSEDDVDLQLWAGDVLHEIIRDAVENNYAVFKDKESEE